MAVGEPHVLAATMLASRVNDQMRPMVAFDRAV